MLTEGILALAAKLPRYKCHKIVNAAAIANINGPDGDGCTRLELAAGTGVFVAHTVDPEWMEKHEPTVGGYLVVYGDGYVSFSPAQVFEDGYTGIGFNDAAAEGAALVDGAGTRVAAGISGLSA